MSFILDALKKAESERHRASGPVLVDVRLAPHRRGLPVWGWVLGIVLLANLAVLAWMMSRKPAVHAGRCRGDCRNRTGCRGHCGSLPPRRCQTHHRPHRRPVPRAPPLPAPATVAPTAGASAAPDPANLPTLQDLQAQGVSLPPLLMNLHVYDATPSLRFVMLNGLRLGEGEFTPDGIKVVAITEHGVVLDARGRRFVLPAGG